MTQEPIADNPGFLVCGCEEPLAPNGMLSAEDPRTGENVLAEFGCPDLNRYSFVWIGPHRGAEDRLNQLLQRIAFRPGSAVTLLSAWVTPGSGAPPVYPGFRIPPSVWEGLRIRAGELRAIHEREGWQLLTAPEVTAALQPVSSARVREGNVWYGLSGTSQTVVLFGEEVNPDELLQPPALRFIRRLGLPRSLAPSQEFLEWLGQRRTSIAYRHKDDLGRWGAVLVSPYRVDIPALEAAGLVDRVHAGAEAERAWRYGPNAT